MTFPDLIYNAMNGASTSQKTVETTGFCACCGTPIEHGIKNQDCISSTTSQHADFFRFGTHVCIACAFLFSIPKISHRNLLATENKLYLPMIGFNPVEVEEKPADRKARKGEDVANAILAVAHRTTWLDTLREISQLSNEAYVTGVLTTDPKPRLWPRTQLVTRSHFGLYLHIPDWDISGFRFFDLDKCLQFTDLIIECLALKFSKVRILKGLVMDYEKFKKNPQWVMEMEIELAAIRDDPAFIPALLISGIKK